MMYCLASKRRLPHCWIALRRMILTTSIALVIPLGAQAQPLPDDFDGMPWLQMPSRGPNPGGPVPPNRALEMSWSRPGSAGSEDRMPQLPMLRSLSLTEAQSDEIFLILHAAAIAQRPQPGRRLSLEGHSSESQRPSAVGSPHGTRKA